MEKRKKSVCKSAIIYDKPTSQSYLNPSAETRNYPRNFMTGSEQFDDQSNSNRYYNTLQKDAHHLYKREGIFKSQRRHNRIADNQQYNQYNFHKSSRKRDQYYCSQSHSRRKRHKIFDQDYIKRQDKLKLMKRSHGSYDNVYKTRLNEENNPISHKLTSHNHKVLYNHRSKPAHRIDNQRLNSVQTFKQKYHQPDSRIRKTSQRIYPALPILSYSPNQQHHRDNMVRSQHLRPGFNQGHIHIPPPFNHNYDKHQKIYPHPYNHSPVKINNQYPVYSSQNPISHPIHHINPPPSYYPPPHKFVPINGTPIPAFTQYFHQSPSIPSPSPQKHYINQKPLVYRSQINNRMNSDLKYHRTNNNLLSVPQDVHENQLKNLNQDTKTQKIRKSKQNSPQLLHKNIITKNRRDSEQKYDEEHNAFYNFSPQRSQQIKISPVLSPSTPNKGLASNQSYKYKYLTISPNRQKQVSVQNPIDNQEYDRFFDMDFKQMTSHANPSHQHNKRPDIDWLKMSSKSIHHKDLNSSQMISPFLKKLERIDDDEDDINIKSNVSIKNNIQQSKELNICQQKSIENEDDQIKSKYVTKPSSLLERVSKASKNIEIQGRVISLLLVGVGVLLIFLQLLK